MKIYLEWLRGLVDCPAGDDELSRALTMGGLEVEADERMDLPSGKPARVFTLNVTPNRGYCLSHIGVAREAASLLGASCRIPDASAELEKVWGPASVKGKIEVEVKDAADCARYSALVIEGVTPEPSPPWLIDRLTAVGLRPINNIVDITNYILMEYGQPLHAFDANELAGGKIVVRRARSGETFVALDGTRATLDTDALVIADAVKPVALAGIMGGSNSQVTGSTRNVVLESACFDPSLVRRASKKYNLRSDSSYRFERGVDIEGAISAQARAALLIRELAGGTICKGRVDVYPQPRAARIIRLRTARVNRMLGCSFDAARIAALLQRLGMQAQPAEEGFDVTVPTWRPGLEREIDLIEEIARLHGYNQFASDAPRAGLGAVRPTPEQKLRKDIKSRLAHLGFSEAVNYSFIESEHAEKFKNVHAGASAKTIPLSNPISADLAVMRTSMIPSLLHAALRNLRQGQKPIKLFEVGSVYWRGEKGEVRETPCLGILAGGPCENTVWKAAGKNYDFYDIKGVLESLSAACRLDAVFRPVKCEYLTPGKSVEMVCGGRRVGLAGELVPALTRQWDLAPAVPYVAELDLGTLLEALPGAAAFASLPKYPEAYRDISLVVDKSLPAGEVEAVIRSAGEPLIRKAELYDHFEGQKLGAGKKSLTFALAFQSPDRTLSDAEVNPVFDNIVKQLAERCGAALRDK